MRPRAKPKTPEKPAAPRKAAVARLVPPPLRDIDDDADDRCDDEPDGRLSSASR